mgnify:CR=1 FL=1
MYQLVRIVPSKDLGDQALGAGIFEPGFPDLPGSPKGIFRNVPPLVDISTLKTSVVTEITSLSLIDIGSGNAVISPSCEATGTDESTGTEGTAFSISVSGGELLSLDMLDTCGDISP